jgi:hypothetical protein
MPKIKQLSSNSNGLKPKRSSSSSKKSTNPQNGHLDLATLRSLKREYLAAETKQARAKVLKPLPKEQQWELTRKWYRSLRTDKARDQFLSMLSLADLHALVVGMIHERPQNGGRLA